MSALRYFIGVDLGMGVEPTALAILERRRIQAEDRAEQRRPPYALRHLHRFPQGTSYPIVAETMVSLLRSKTLSGERLLIDFTGVGRAVLRLLIQGLRGANYCVTAVLLTAGHNVVNPASGELHVAKTDLVGTLQVLLQTRRLQVASELPDARLLVRELENYRPKVTLPTTEAMAWRDGANDDLMFAVALAALGGERDLLSEGRGDQRLSYR